MIGCFYAFITLVVATAQAAVPDDYYRGSTRLPLGIALFAASVLEDPGSWAAGASVRASAMWKAWLTGARHHNCGWQVGQLGNLWHHWLLARMRSAGGTGYAIPRGGLFDLVTMPHYFFELLAWFGIAAVGAALNVVRRATSAPNSAPGSTAGKGKGKGVAA